MSQVGNVSDVSSEAIKGTEISRESFGDAVEKFLNALASTKGRKWNPSKSKLNEEQIYGSLVYELLNSKNKKAAKKLLKHIPSYFKSFKDKGHPKPIFMAVKKALDELVKQGLIDRDTARSVRLKAMGKAQMDGRPNKLGSRRLKFKPAASGREYIDRIFDKVSSNSAATREQLKKIKAAIKKAKEKGVVYNPKGKRAVIIKETDRADKKDPVGRTGKEKIDKVENDSETKVVDGSDIHFSAYDLGYKPYSQKDGNALVQIPVTLADEAVDVRIVSWDGDEVAKAEVRWLDEEGQKYARFDRPGTEFGKRFYLEIDFVDGAVHREVIEDSSKVYSRFV